MHRSRLLKYKEQQKKGFNAAELLQMVDIVQKIIPMLFQAQQQAIARAKINQ